MLDIIMRFFLKGLSDSDVRRKAIRGLAQANRSLRGIYTIADEARRTKMELQKLANKDQKSRELEFYRKVAEKNISPIQISALITSFYTV